MIRREKNIFSKLKLKPIPLGELISDMKAGFSSGKFELENGDIAHLRPMNIDNDCKLVHEGTKYITHSLFKEKQEYKLKKGDILFNNTNSTELVGKSCYINEDMNSGFSNHMTRIRVNPKKVNGVYLSHLFHGMFKYRIFESYCHKWVGQSGINTEILSNILIPVPPLEEQTQIAELFQSIETVIAQAEQQEKNLLNLKNQLLRELAGEKMQFGIYLKAKDFEKVKFEQIAFNISERVEPKVTKLATYVGLEHLDANNLKIERTGSPDDVIGTKLKIYKGDIIFGKRRAYLRKVAVSHFDGIASAHSMILRANEKNIEKNFLPHFMQSDVFMNRAVQISEGSLSPTIKAKTLLQQEFILPKKEKQKQLVEVFEQFDKTRNEIRTQKQTLKNLKQKLLNEILG